MDEKQGYAMEDTFKGQSAHYENAVARSESEGGALDGVIRRPARVFTPEEEKKLYRKIDRRIMPILALLYLLSFMDRSNIGNARLNGLEADLNMDSTQYNLAVSCFFITYCFCEVPANLVLKKCRPSYWLGGLTIVWGAVMGVTTSFGGLIAARLALGIAEAGLFPGVILYISLWYPRHISQSRVAFFFGAATLAGAFSGLLAYGIGFMAGVGGKGGWAWIFILEGLLTVLAGVLAIFTIADYPMSSNWLTPEEQEWVAYRLATDGSSVGEGHEVKSKYIWAAFKDWQIYVSTAYYMAIVIPLYSISLIMPTLIRAFGQFTTPQIQLLTIPVYFVACVFVLCTALLADRMRKRFMFVMIDLSLCLVGLLINLTPAPVGVKYFGLFLIASGAYGGLPTVVTWLTNNLSGSTKRGVGSAFQIGIGNLGALVSSNVYRSADSPRYYLGHGVVLGFVAMGFITAPLYAFLLKRENNKKEKLQAEQDALPDHEKRVYTVQELRDMGDRAPEFVYTI
ncbi:uncharacterized protein JCM6883_005388 [Sporobolomyces salmoneus]|uniref:uncharacterized protein n=1 Tax=Sporobolomyces salmoneus TaxID=183962 RepID=UPI003171419C